MTEESNLVLCSMNPTRKVCTYSHSEYISSFSVVLIRISIFHILYSVELEKYVNWWRRKGVMRNATESDAPSF